MERLFSPCTRYRDLLHSQAHTGHLEWLQVRELNLDVSTDELFSPGRAFTYADLYAVLGNEDTVVWLTPHVAVARGGGCALLCWNLLDESCSFWFSANGKLKAAFARSPEHLLEICDVVRTSIVGSKRRSFSYSRKRFFSFCIGQCSHFGVYDGTVPKSEVFIIEGSRHE
jgi:hypothetical protein